VPRPAFTQPRGDAAAQSQSVLRGNVVADPGERPLGDTDVSLPALGRVARTDSAGDFVLAGLPAGRLDAKSPMACWANVYVDGAKIYATGTPLPPPNVAAMTGRTVVAVEYYAGGASTPIEYGGTDTSCGTVLVWTRR
jgi:hypothetical protein